MEYLENGKIIVNDLDELRIIVENKTIPLNLIDIKESGLTSLEQLFDGIDEINGSIENWDVSNINKLNYTFIYSHLNLDLSKWDVSNCNDMTSMFANSNFNNNSLRDWNVSNVKNMDTMFYQTKFDGDVSNWNISNCLTMSRIFQYSEFCGDISKWNFNKDVNCYNIVIGNINFQNYYNKNKVMPNSTKEFLLWFKENRDKIKELNQGTKEEILNFFSFPCFSEQVMQKQLNCFYYNEKEIKL